jgi:septal ring factor EnvC (AmiA/AmiB activator)
MSVKSKIEILLEKKLKKTREEKRLDKAKWKRESMWLNWDVKDLRKDLKEVEAEKVEYKKEIKKLKKKFEDMQRRHAHDREVLQDYIDTEYEYNYN